MGVTKVIKLDPFSPDPEGIKSAAGLIAEGGLVIIPTETVYGIACSSGDDKAMQRLSALKERPADKPFSLHIDRFEKAELYAKEIPVIGYKLMDKFWPGPLTLVFKAKDNPTVGMRMPDNEVALEVISAAPVPLVCPSANLAGRPPPRTLEEALADLDGKVDLALDTGRTKLGLESSVADLTSAHLLLLREGAVKKEDLERVASTKTVLLVCTGNSCRSVMAKALLERQLKKDNRQGIEVLSAGIMMMDGMGASDSARELLSREGIDVSGHRSRRVTPLMIKKSELILVMERLQEERILSLVPEAKNKVFLLKEFAKIDSASLDIEDPIGKSLETYERVFQVIKEAIEKIAQLI